jgi:phage shock protein E
MEKPYITRIKWRNGGVSVSEDAKIMLDIRSEDEYEEGHIPGAKNCQLQELSFLLGDVEADDKIVLVCRTGKRATQVKALLEDEGYHNVEVLQGGMTAYKGELEKGE